MFTACKSKLYRGYVYSLIIGNKKNNVDIIYTPWSNLKKTQGMEIGEVSFHRSNQVRRFHIEKKDNATINRLQKTKTEHIIDYAQERISRARGLRALQKDQENAKVCMLTHLMHLERRAFSCPKC